MAEDKLTAEDCLSLLQRKQKELTARGEERYPKRSDFTEREVVAIKAFFGPWPRALETASLKPPREDDRKQRNAEKRIRAKRNRRLAQKSETEGGSASLTEAPSAPPKKKLQTR